MEAGACIRDFNFIKRLNKIFLGHSFYFIINEVYEAEAASRPQRTTTAFTTLASISVTITGGIIVAVHYYV